MRISYQREFKYNYLIIDPEEILWQGYESQMLSKNQIDGILRFQLRQKDDGVRFYYEITSRQPVARILESRSIRAEEIRRLVIGIFGVLERMDLYLLREGSILLEPEYLYMDPDTFRVWLCLVPGMKRDFPEAFSRFLEYLLGSVDHQDKESVVLAYGLYQETRKENYGLEDLKRLLQQEKGSGSQEPGNRDVQRSFETENRKIEEDRTGFHEEGENWLDIWQNKGKKQEELHKTEWHSGSKRQAQEKMVKRKPWWKRWKGHGLHQSGKADSSPARAPREMMVREESIQSWFPPAEESGQDRGHTILTADSAAFRSLSMSEYSKEQQAQTGQGTVLLADFSSDTGQRVLRALDSGGENIPLPYYPFIIGKQDNLVDYKLERETVSRLHVRIDQAGEGYRIKDLNSTNGTFLRGRLLENNEEAELHIGDEVCIARYRYRFE